MTFEGAGQEAEFVSLDVRLVLLRDEDVLFMQDAEIGQYPDCFPSGGVHGFVLRRGYRKDFRQCNLECDRYVGFLADNTVVFHGHDRELAFERGCF